MKTFFILGIMIFYTRVNIYVLIQFGIKIRYQTASERTPITYSGLPANEQQ